MANLKNKYRKHLITFLVANVAAYLVVSVGGDITDMQKTFEALMSEKGLFIALSPISILVINGLLSAHCKARLIFWKYSNPLPGSEAFSKHAKNDPRINVASLKRSWGTLPCEPLEQNRLWYKMYRSVESDVRVFESHYNWLFARDLAAFSVIFLFVFPIIGLVSISSESMYWYYLFALITQYLIVVISAQTYGKRFVSNVLASASKR